MLPDLRWIVTALAERIAPQDSPEALECAADCAVFLDRFDHVVAARRAEAALPAEDRAERELIDAHGRDDGERGKAGECG